MAPERSTATWQELRAGMEFLGWSPEQLWIAYFSIGGSRPQASVERWMTGREDLPDREHDLLAAALNDQFLERGLGHPVRYLADG